MSIVTMLVIGGIVGWLAAAVAGRREGIIASVIIGIIGAIIGGVLARAVGSSDAGLGALSWASVAWSFIGAVILVAIMNAVQHRSHHHV